MSDSTSLRATDAGDYTRPVLEDDDTQALACEHISGRTWAALLLINGGIWVGAIYGLWQVVR